MKRIHGYVKDQIMGHAAAETNRVYKHVPQAPLIDEIKTLPTIADWLAQDWMTAPVALVGRRASSLKKAERAAGQQAFEAWQAERLAA
ncbi:MAG: hypothetical protein QM576_08750 [Rhodopseudomonas sp.]|uniref:hypothetical protein n=1 Tax=Rhodopseudomonas sp. TaxID=1078 RepID=UPI0039E4EAE6